MEKKIMENANLGFRILRGRFRLLFGFCPNCNSDAPKIYDCKVCEGGKYYLQNYWWKKFKNNNYGMHKTKL